MSSAGWFAKLSKTWKWGMLCALPYAVCGCSAQSSDSAEPPSARCASCHLQEFQSTTHPPHPGVRPTTCAVCHGETGWHPVRSPFLHSFPLEGGHSKLTCFACHGGASPQFEGTTHECVACHRQEQASANVKVAHHDTFPAKCDTCHTINAWKPTLPHDETFAEPASATEPAAAPPGSSSANALGSTPPAAKKPVPGVSRPSTTPKKTWTPDQVSGASRVKQR
ncbi:MAG: hypothetical protein ABJB12_07715 [Pseudomonadota bacterium]